MLCPHCNRESDALFKFCLHCGKELVSRKSAPANDGKMAQVAQKPQPKPARPVTSDLPSTRIPPAEAPAPAPITASALEPVQAPEQAQPLKEPSVAASDGRNQLGWLVSVHATDVSDSKRIPVYAGTTTLGRGQCDVVFADDDLLSPLHLALEVSADKALLTCLGSRNGTFVRLTDPVVLTHNQTFRMGQQLLRYEDLTVIDSFIPEPADGSTVLGSPAGAKAWGRLTQVVSESLSGSSFLLAGDSVFLGRERGTFTFPGDRYISGTHAVLIRKDDTTWLKDVGSSNGTYYRISGTIELAPGQFFLAGRQLFRLELEP